MSDEGVWVKVYGTDPGENGKDAVISGSTGATETKGVVIDGRTYDIYTFTTPTTTSRTVLTPASRQAIQEYESDAENPEVPPEDIIEYETIPASDPGLDITVSEDGFIDVLIVGGGGGGGSGACGGGGAGQFFETRAFIDAGTYSVTVGEGGIGMAGSIAFSAKAGGQSGVGIYWAVGGGAALGRSEGGGDGGSGAGAGDIELDAFGVTTADGNSGGRGGSQCGGGGGGAAQPGEDGSGSATRKGGDGGDGKESLITGTSVFLAGGGGANGAFEAGAGGAGGGGEGQVSGGGGAAQDNTGGGGGAGGSGGGAGGSGIVIVRVGV